MFGHEKGAFTGAVAAKAGLLESAEGGTVFLDEVGEMPLSLQAKLLRVLEQREVLRVGALRPRAIDVRFLSATNRDLEQELHASAFAEISTTASTGSPSSSRRFGSGSTRSSRWRVTSSGTPVASRGRPSSTLRPTRWRFSRRTNGPAIFAS